MTTENYQWQSFDDGDDGSQSESRQDAKGMRAQLEKMAAELKSVRGEYTKLKAERDRGTVAEHVKTLGFAPEAAQFYPADGATTPDAVKTWLDKNQGVFAKLQAESTTAAAESDVVVDEEVASTEVKSAIPKDVEGMYRMLQDLEIVPPDGAQDMHTKLMNATSQKEILELIGAPEAATFEE